MMDAVAEARRAALKRYFRPGHRAIASINSPMQCMMKEICAQCLQRHCDPATGTETVVFSCFNQDQEMDRVDFPSPAPPPVAERRAGEADQAVDRPLPQAPRPPRGDRGVKWVPAQAGTHSSTVEQIEPWVPACAGT